MAENEMTHQIQKELPSLPSESLATRHGRFRLAQNAEILSAIIGVIGAVAALVLSFSYLANSERVSRTSRAIMEELRNQRSSMMELRIRMDLVQRQLANELPRLSADSVPFSEEYRILAQRQGELDARLSNVERVISTDAAKELNILLLRNEVNAAKESNTAASIRMDEDIARIHDLMKWIIALMFAMSLGVLSLAVARIFRTGGNR
jgi:hypothetical protein